MDIDSKRRVQLGAGIGVFVFAVVFSYFFGVTEATGISDYDIYLALDVSGSMMSPPTKLASAKDAANEFVNALELGTSSDIRVGLIVFSSGVATLVSLTNDQNQLDNAISQLGAGGETAMGDAIFEATQKLSAEARPDAKKVILLLSDGVPTAGMDSLVAARSASTNDVSIFAVGYGFDADMNLLSQIASVTGGKSYEAVTGQDLVDTFRDIASVIISPVVQYGSRTMVLVAIPIILFIPAIEKGLTTFIGQKQKPTTITCPKCNRSNALTAKFCAKCGNPLRRS